MENISMLPLPASRQTVGNRFLSDLTDSDTNARNKMPPPASAGGLVLKRVGSNLPEPASKRKTLVERAGEPIPKSWSTSRPGSAASQNTSNSSTLYRGSSNNSALSRTTSSSSCNTSSSSHIGSLNMTNPSTTVAKFSGVSRLKPGYGKSQSMRVNGKVGIGLTELTQSHEIDVNKSKDPFLLPPSGRPFPKSFGHDLMPSPRIRKAASTMNILHFTGPDSLSIQSPSYQARRETSVSDLFNRMHMSDRKPVSRPAQSPDNRIRASVSKIPSPLQTPTKPIRLSPCKSVSKIKQFLTPSSNVELFDPDEQYNNFKRIAEDLAAKFENTNQENNGYKESLQKLEQEREMRTESIILLTADNQTLKFRLETATKAISEKKEEHDLHIKDLVDRHQLEIENLKEIHRSEMERLRSEHERQAQDLGLKHQHDLDVERAQKVEALTQVSSQGVLQLEKHALELARKDQEITEVKLDLTSIEAALAKQKELAEELRLLLQQARESITMASVRNDEYQNKIRYLETDSKSQSDQFTKMEMRMKEAQEKSEEIQARLRKEEGIRRKLHNQVQELKGNIRVFCRVRPPSERSEEELARIKYPDQDDCTEIEIRGVDKVSSLGKDMTERHPFTFDRVFDPTCTNSDIFVEISQLIQSALDGFNVCIFAYGQTGSGKTHTMSSADGMIPKALHMIYDTSKELEERGWKYNMQGSFVEVYNEELRDLLCEEASDNRKHEIQHDTNTMETTVTNVNTYDLDDKDRVESLLARATARRTTASTKANEHSSRSHSIFILKLTGCNTVTGETRKGTLNLVDLAGSERISHADTSGTRLKETQNINTSLSSLGDVIGALGKAQGCPVPGSDNRSSVKGGRDSSLSGATAHIPYRNSKLTYLLQFSLGGNSKTLMFVMIAPEKKCVSETVTSLKFADKVSKTKIGIARRSR